MKIIEMRSTYIYQYNRYISWYKIEVNNEGTEIKLINKETNEIIMKGKKRILNYLANRDMEIRAE